MKKALAASLMCMVLLACSDWERTTFQTLSASKAAIDKSQSDYENRTIPHNQCVYDVISKAKASQTLAVDAMMTYETAKGTSGATAAQSVVTADLAQLAPIIANIQTLGTATCKQTSQNQPQVNDLQYGGLYAYGSIGSK